MVVLDEMAAVFKKLVLSMFIARCVSMCHVCGILVCMGTHSSAFYKDAS